MLTGWNEKLNAMSYPWNNFIRIATHTVGCLWNMVKSTPKGEFYPCAVFSTKVLLKDGRHAKREFRAVPQ